MGDLFDDFGFKDVFKNDVFSQPNKKENFIKNHKELVPDIFFEQKSNLRPNGKARGSTPEPLVITEEEQRTVLDEDILPQVSQIILKSTTIPPTVRKTTPITTAPKTRKPIHNSKS